MGVDVNASVRDFLEDTASKSPTPGGGSVSALAGALASALIAMVCRLTQGKKGYEEVQNDVDALLAKSEELRSSLSSLIEADAAAYDSVAEALRMDRSTDEAKKRRRAALQEALRKAALVPLDTAKSSVRALEMAMEVAEKGNVNAVSDAGTAAWLAIAAFKGAELNVRINIEAIKDQEFVEKLQEELRSLRSQAEKAHSRAVAIVETRL